MSRQVVPITGRTAVLGIIGEPLAQAATPGLMNQELALRGQDAVLVPFGVGASHLESALDGLREVTSFAGAVVTMPHKQTAMALLDHVTPRAREIGAVNVLKRLPHGKLAGDMLDGIGFIVGLGNLMPELRGRRVLIAGAGGAATALAFACARAEAVVGIMNRSSERAELLVERLAQAKLNGEVISAPTQGWDVVVNATSLGLKADDEIPVPEQTLLSRPVVSDIVISDYGDTSLIRAARKFGCPSQNGLPMLAGQIRLMADFILSDDDHSGRFS